MGYDFLKGQTKQFLLHTGLPGVSLLSIFCPISDYSLSPFPKTPSSKHECDFILISVAVCTSGHAGHYVQNTLAAFPSCHCSLQHWCLPGNSPCPSFTTESTVSPLSLGPDSWAASQAPDILNGRLSDVTKWMEQGAGIWEPGARKGCEGLQQREPGREAAKPVFQWTSIFLNLNWQTGRSSAWKDICLRRCKFLPSVHKQACVHTHTQSHISVRRHQPYHATYRHAFSYSNMHVQQPPDIPFAYSSTHKQHRYTDLFIHASHITLNYTYPYTDPYIHI